MQVKQWAHFMKFIIILRNERVIIRMFQLQTVQLSGLDGSAKVRIRLYTAFTKALLSGFGTKHEELLTKVPSIDSC